MANKYLDLTGVGELWKLIKTADDNVKKAITDELATMADTIGATIGRAGGNIVLKNAKNEIISSFPEADFVKDGVLQSVEIITATDGAFTYDGAEVKAGEKFIKFTWNTDAGAGAEDNDSVSNVTYLKVSEIAPAYTGTGGIVVNTSNQISIEEVDAAKTTLSKDIEVKGGPLADDANNWPDAWKKDGKNIIPANASLEDILTNLFLKVINGTVTFGTVAWSKSLGNPTVTLSLDGPVEVGSTVKLKSVTAGNASSGKRNITLTTTQGFFDTATPGVYNSATSFVYYGASSSVTGTAVYSYKWNDAALTDFVVNSTELRIKEGENKIVVTQSGQTAIAAGVTAKTVHASTNTKVELTDVTAQFGGEDAEYTAALSSTGYDTITGGYYAFVDFTDTIPATSTEVRELMGKARIGKGSVGTKDTEYKITKNYMAVAIPTGWDFTIQNSLGQADQRNSFEKTSSELLVSLPDGSTKKYDVYTIGWKDGVYKNLVIK